uniref:Uncharacterized protein n=1 Tax=Mycena chlorophos TaxID=658473 RepID=A0ABQ0L5H1_MYCCL|nr:predicted protein [Mycena chlorophos]
MPLHLNLTHGPSKKVPVSRTSPIELRSALRTLQSALSARDIRIDCLGNDHKTKQNTRARRNNAEAFIARRCSTVVRHFVRVELRGGSKSAWKHEFWSAWTRFQRQKAAQGIERRQKAKERRLAADAKLAAIVVELDLDTIESMSRDKLREQLQDHREIRRNDILLTKKWKDHDMRRMGGCREAKLRVLQRWGSYQPKTPSASQQSTNGIELDDEDEIRENDADWEDIDM